MKFFNFCNYCNRPKKERQTCNVFLVSQFQTFSHSEGLFAFFTLVYATVYTTPLSQIISMHFKVEDWPFDEESH